jgi:hypothetical protein
MVSPDTRNNFIVIVVIIAVAFLVATFVYIFANSILQVANHGETTMNKIGKAVAGNVSNATQINSLNLMQFNKSMTDVIKSNGRIVASNNATIGNLTDTVMNFSKANIANGMGLKNLIGNNTKIFAALYKEQKRASDILQNMSKQLKIVPVTPIPTPSPTQNKTCNIYSPGFPFCILPPTHPIFDLINKTHNNATH